MSLTPRIDRLDKRYIMNAGLDFWQRGGATAPVDVAGAYDYKAPDRFLIEATNFTGAANLQRSTDVPAGAKYKHSMNLTGSMAAGCTFGAKQRIESVFARELINEKISLVTQAKSDNLQTLTVTISYADVEDDFSSVSLAHTQVFTLLANTTWEEILFEDLVLGPLAANGVEVECYFNNEGTVGTGSVWLAGMQVNVGPTSNGFALMGRDYVEELQLCQRYLEYWTGAITGYSDGNSNVESPIQFQVAKRVLPVPTTFGTWQTLGAGGGPFGEPYSIYGGAIRVNWSGAVGMHIKRVNSPDDRIEFDAEL